MSYKIWTHKIAIRTSGKGICFWELKKVTEEITRWFVWTEVRRVSEGGFLISCGSEQHLICGCPFTSPDIDLLGACALFSNRARVPWGLPEMCDVNILRFHLKWNRIILQSHFHESYSDTGHSLEPRIDCICGNIVTEWNSFLLALASSELPCKGKSEGINTMCMW